MGNMVNILIFYVTVSLFLYGAQIHGTDGKLFANDLLSDWVKQDSSGNFTGSLGSGSIDSSNQVLGYGANGVSSGTSFFNFWDMLQIGWSFIKMIFNIFLVIPISMMQLGLPTFFIILLVAFVIIALSVFILGMMNKR